MKLVRCMFLYSIVVSGIFHFSFARALFGAKLLGFWCGMIFAVWLTRFWDDMVGLRTSFAGL